MVSPFIHESHSEMMETTSDKEGKTMTFCDESVKQKDMEVANRQTIFVTKAILPQEICTLMYLFVGPFSFLSDVLSVNRNGK